MNKTATKFVDRMKAYMEKRNMSTEGKLGFLTNLRKQLLESEALQTDKLNNIHDRIVEIDKWIKELKEAK